MRDSIIAGVVSGLLSSIILYFVLFKIKPKVSLSQYICRSRDEKEYKIKIVNLSHSNLVDVDYSLHACYRTEDGIKDIREISPAKSKLKFIQAYSREDKDADYAVRITYNLEDIVTEGNYTSLLFTFYAKHAISGTGIFLRKEFHDQDIKCGCFETGKSTKIILESCHKSFSSSCISTCSEQRN